MKTATFNIQKKKLSIIEWLLKIQEEILIKKISALVEKSIDNWKELSEEQQAELEQAIHEINNGKGITHDVAMAKLRNR